MNLFKNSVFLVFDKFFILFLSLILSIATYRILGPEQVGILTSAQSFWAMFGFLVSLGLDTIVVKYLVKYKSKKDYILTTAFIIKAIGSLLAIMTALFISFIYSSDTIFHLVLFIISLNAFFQSFIVIDLYLQANHISRYGAYSRIIARIVSSIFHICLLLLTNDIYLFASVNLLYNAVLIMIYLYLKRKHHLSISMSYFNKKLARFLLIKSLPLILSAISVPLFLQTDVLMINYILGSYETGIYSASVKLVMPLTLFSTAIMIAYFPILVSNKNDVNFVKTSMIEISSFLIWSGIIIASIVSIFSIEIISLLYSDEYERSAELLKLQIWTIVIAFIGPIGTRWLIMNNYQWIEFEKVVLAAIVNILLNMYLIPKYGAHGAIVASLFSYFVANILVFIIIKKTNILFLYYVKALNPMYALKLIFHLRSK